LGGHEPPSGIDHAAEAADSGLGTFAANCGRALLVLGEHRLRDLKEPVAVFALD